MMQTAETQTKTDDSRPVYPPNINLIHLNSCLKAGKRGVVLEGGSRSGKTWSGIDFTIKICADNSGLIFNYVKETYNGFKTTIYDDFSKRLDWLSLPNPFAQARDVPSFKLFGNTINFMGADQPSKFHGAGCDFFFINEALPVSQSIFDQLEMRCRRFWWIDFNPSVSQHWIFDKLEKREDVSFLKSTMINNPAIGKWERQKILSYNPNDPENVRRGTADDYMWAVYGEGKRASPQGLVYPNVTWIQDFPEDIEDIIYGMDFGYTNSPTAIVKIGRSGQNIFLKLLYYEPCDDPQRLSEVIKHVVGDGRIWADSADPQMISDLRRRGCSVFPVVKKEDSVRFGISLMKDFKIHIVNDADFRKEAENYKWMEIHGIRVNEPVKAYDHAWDAARYGVMMEFRGGK